MAGIGQGAGFGALAGGDMGLYSPLTRSLQGNGVNKSAFFGKTNVDFERTDSWTWLVWLKAASGNGGVICGKHNWSSGKGWSGQLLTGANAGDVYMDIEDGLNTISARYALSLDDNAWHVVGGTYDGSSVPSGIELWADGVKGVSATTGTSLGATIKDATAEIGTFSTWLRPAALFNGSLCHWAIWDQKLTDPEMAAVMNALGPRNLDHPSAPSGLVRWCTMGDGCAIGVGNMIDLSTSGEDGDTYNFLAGDFQTEAPP